MAYAVRRRLKLYEPYTVMLAVYIAFIVSAFILESPGELLCGFLRILGSKSLLITDYIAVGGIGATLLNAAFVGSAGVLMLTVSKIKPNGATVMAMWLTTGFAFFGKNIFNMIPLTVGVWLFSKYEKAPFANYSLAALLVATVSPAVSEVSFLGIFSRPAEILLGVLFGFLIGFIFPSVSSGAVRLHGGYNLYNMGFAGGLICMVAYSVMKSAGLDIETARILSEGNNILLASGLYSLSAGLLCCGLFLGSARENLRGFAAIFKRSGRLVSDFFYDHGNGIYLNMAALCAFSTTLVLALGGQLSGPVIAGIFTVTAFGSFGKHLKNVIPILLGAFLFVLFSKWDENFSVKMITVLFSTGLAPVAGQFGWLWGAAAGFLHMTVAMHTAHLSGGMNLYNNGFAAGFAAMFLLPLITAFRKGKTNEG